MSPALPSSKEPLPLSVDSMGLMLDRLGLGCAPRQFLRELTRNSIEAVLRTSSKNGEIRWDVDWSTAARYSYSWVLASRFVFRFGSSFEESTFGRSVHDTSRTGRRSGGPAHLSGAAELDYASRLLASRGDGLREDFRDVPRQRRNRLFVYEQYLSTLNEGTEPP